MVDMKMGKEMQPRPSLASPPLGSRNDGRRVKRMKLNDEPNYRGTMIVCCVALFRILFATQ